MSLKYKAVFSAIVLGFASMSANAASSSSATLGPIVVTLIDLNPYDALLPSITWSNPPLIGGGSYGYASAADSASSSYQSDSAYRDNHFSSLAISSATAQSGASANFTGGADFSAPDGSSFFLSGHAGGTSVQGQYSGYNASAGSSQKPPASFTLSAYTLVVFSAVANASAATTVGQSPWGGEWASASAYLQVWGSAPGGNSGSQSSYASLDASTNYASKDPSANPRGDRGTAQRITQTLTDTLSGSFINYTSSEKAGYFQAGGNIWGTSSVPAVPEPETYAMMLAGLGLLGVAARRGSGR